MPGWRFAQLLLIGVGLEALAWLLGFFVDQCSPLWLALAGVAGAVGGAARRLGRGLPAEDRAEEELKKAHGDLIASPAETAIRERGNAKKTGPLPRPPEPPEPVSLEKLSYEDLKRRGLTDADILKMFGR